MQKTRTWPKQVSLIVPLALMAFICLTPAVVMGQVFSTERPPPVLSQPIYWNSSGSALHTAPACTGGPGMMMTIATAEGALIAYGSNDKQWEVLPPWGFEPTGGIGYSIRGLANTWDQEQYLVGFQPETWMSSLPIVSVTVHGEVSITVTGSELEAVAGESVLVSSITPTDDGLFYARLKGENADLLVHIDPAKAEGDRVQVVLDRATLEVAVPPGEGNYLAEWGRSLAAASDGSIWLQLFFEDGDIATGWGCLLVRRDADGTYHELTARHEHQWAGAAPLPASAVLCQGIGQGLMYDPELELLVGAGAGMWLIDPEVPGQFEELVPGFAVETMAYFFTEGEYIYGSVGVVGPGTCLGFSGAAGVRVYGTRQSILYSAAIFRDELDIDHDFLARWEEDILGTDPRLADTDGDGVEDGPERLDGTDPLDAGSVRAFEPDVEAWSMSARYVGSRFHKSLLDMGAGWITRWGAALSDGTFGVTTQPDGTEQEFEFYRFTDWDEPAEKLPVQSCEERVAAGPDGSLFCTWNNGLKAATFNAASGDPAVPLLSPAEQLLLDEELFNAVDFVVRPDGAVFVGGRDGKLLRRDPGESFRVIYDARLDMENAGIVSPGSQNWCFEGLCQCTASVGPVTWDPVRSLLYFWVQAGTKCGTSPTGLNPMLVVQRHDGSLRGVGDHSDLSAAVGEYGGQQIQDMEPDMNGGLWVLTTGGIDRSLYHFNENLEARRVDFFRIPSGHAPWGAPEGQLPNRGLSHGDELIVTPDGRLFILPTYYYYMSPPYYFLSEVIPIESVVKPGRFVTVHGGTRTLGVLDQRGAGMALYTGDPLVQPMTVTATFEEIYVGDPGADTIWRFPLDDEGRVGEPGAFVVGFEPGGLDIGEDGNLLAVDRSAQRVVRVESDGAVVEVIAPGILGAPFDLVAEAGAVLVTDNQTGAVQRIPEQGPPETIATVPGAASIALDDGRGYVVASSQTGNAPVRLTPGASGTLEGAALSEETFQYDLSQFNGSGGVAVDSDGNVYWMVSLPAGLDVQVAKTQAVRALRVTRDGYASPLLRSSLGASNLVAGISAVRVKGAPMPTRPGTLEPWSDEDPDPSSPESPDTDLSAQPEPDVGGDDPDVVCGEEGGGCVASPVGSACWPPLLALALLMLLRRRRLATPLLILAVVTSAACSSGSGDQCETPDDVVGSRSELPVYNPEVIAPECEGKDLCQPGRDPACQGTSAYRICRQDPDGCFVWSGPVPCLGGQTCSDGSCALCASNCHGAECGDDGCGGICGTCVAPDQCCHSYCAPCLSNCDGKVCGDDGAGGSCGECVDDIFCIDGECRYITEKLTCAEYLVCTEVCWPWDDTCFKDCETLATPKALAQNGLLTGCVFTECATCLELPEPAAEECLDHCLVFECPGALGLCVGTGEEADCPALVSCLEDCQGDSECMVECFELDGHSSAGVFEAWLDCARSECDLDGLPDMDDACVSEAAEGPCDEEYLVCFVL